MNGNIITTSQLGFGTSFTLQIPLKVSEKALKMKDIFTPTLPDSQNQLLINTSKTTDVIMLRKPMQQEDSNCELQIQISQANILKQAIYADMKEQYTTQAKEILSSFYQITCAYSGQEIMKLYKEMEYCQLVILSAKYGDLDGFQVAEQLRKINQVIVKKKNQVSNEQKKTKKKQMAKFLYIVMVVKDEIQKTMYDAVESQIDHIFIRDNLNKEVWSLLQEIQNKQDTLNAQNPSKNNYYVLIIEDNTFIQELLETLFQEQNMKCIKSFDGQDGYEKFVKYQKQIQLIIIDYEMPILSGIECIRLIRKLEEKNTTEQKIHVPIILSSGHEGEKYENEAEEVGAMYVKKPITNQKIREILKDYHIQPN